MTMWWCHFFAKFSFGAAVPVARTHRSVVLMWWPRPFPSETRLGLTNCTVYIVYTNNCIQLLACHYPSHAQVDQCLRGVRRCTSSTRHGPRCYVLLNS